MRLFPTVNRTTLDSFHRDVYRPRLSLLLLILLLILGQQHQNEQAQNRSTDYRIDARQLTTKANSDNDGKLKSKSSSKPVLDGGLYRQLTPLLNQLPNRVKLDHNSIVLRWVKKAGELTWKGTSQEGEKIAGAIPMEKRQSDQIKDLLSKRMAARKLASNKSTFSNPLRRTKGEKKKKKGQTYRSLLTKVLNTDALAALVTLHILWIIRLGSMLLEDRLGKENSSTSSNLSAYQPYVFFWLSGSALLAFLSVSFTWSEFFQRWGVTRPPAYSTPTMSIKIIIILELSATFVSFLSPLFRLKLSPLSRILPRKISLPSPSHSPSLLDLLPIPAGLLEALKAPREDPTMYRRRTTNQWHGGGRQLIAAPLPRTSIGDLTGAGVAAANNPTPVPENAGQHRRNGIAEPLRMPSTNPGKAPRKKNMRVNVDSSWFLENVIILYGHSVGAIQYIVVIASLPTFAPTSFPSLLSLLSLRSALGSVVMTWCSARRSIECLEFVQRRWSQTQSQPQADRTSDHSISPTSSLCSMCFEDVDDTYDPEDRCTLDCGHQLHSVCLVQWLTKQAFCPCCHSTLKATPPSMRSMSETATAPT